MNATNPMDFLDALEPEQWAADAAARALQVMRERVRSTR